MLVKGPLSVATTRFFITISTNPIVFFFQGYLSAQFDGPIRIFIKKHGLFDLDLAKLNLKFGSVRSTACSIEAISKGDT